MSGTSFENFRDFYESVYAGAIDESRTGGRIGACVLRASQGAGDWSDAPTPDLVLAFLSRHEVRGAVDCGSGRFSTRINPGSFVAAPPMCQTTFLLERRNDVLAVALPYARLLAFCGSDSGMPRDGDLGPLHGRFTSDRQTVRLVHALWDSLGASERGCTLAADGLVLGLASRLMVLARARVADLRHGRLTAWQFGRVRDYVQDHLHEAIDLDRLAGALDLSVFHFARCFKATTGTTPHRYVMAMRAERAAAMLAQPSATISRVAMECGYASSQHFSTAFRSIMGLTPSDYRRRSGPAVADSES